MTVRTYIFTARERELIRAFLEGRARGEDKPVGQILWRMRSFKDLSRDVDLYLKLRRRLAESEPAAST